jgi:hypothetical protein
MTNYTQQKKEGSMDKSNSIVAIYPSHTDAEAAVKELQKSGFNLKQLSIVGRDYHTDEHVVGYYNVGDRMKAWGKTGAFWGRAVGTFVRFSVLLGSRIGADSQLDRRGAGRRHRVGRSERDWGRLIQHRHPQGQHFAVRVST